MAAHPALRFLPALLLTAVGAALAAFLVPQEFAAVEEHLLGFPQADPGTHTLRPYVLGTLCFLPAMGALLYGAAGALDRYLARQMLGSVAVCIAALIVIWILLDLNDNVAELRRAENPFLFFLRYYGVTFAPMFVLMAPFALLLGLLYSLGKLSNSREIIAMIQTGRGVARVIAPLTTVGAFVSLACLLLNYHWAPWGEGYQDALLEFAREGSASQARNVLYHNDDTHRTWLVGRFPYDYSKGTPLRDVEITTKTAEGELVYRLKAPIAAWDLQTREWRFQDPEVLELQHELMPKFEKLPSPYVISEWPETPWQLVTPGLRPRYLGVPGLKTWLNENRGVEWANRRPFLTQWYYRFAQPWICLVMVLLAAPLGIVFSRRGVAGGVAIAVLLCGLMLFTAEVFLALGDSGYVAPVLAAWGTNVIFVAVALFLLSRRLRGRPIYQTLKRLMPAS
ncbi:MAG: YjgP/YjgQ family permease [Akkermansiaceae bacterium]|nr:YjgP/YjgQ family permease [Akkermansiaceae bacterium]